MEIFDQLMHLGVDKLLWVLVILVGSIIAIKYIMKLFSKALEHIPSIDPALHSMVKAVVKFILYFLAVMMAASIIGIPVTSFLALFSVVGLAVSLAVQGTLSNLAGGVIILASKMFTLNDFVEADSISGTVKEIGFMYTRLLSPDGKTIYVPNSLLHSTRLINYTVNGSRRVDITVSASYNNSPAEVRETAMDILSTYSAVAAEPAPAVVVDSYGDNAINYIIRFWVRNEDFWPTRHGVAEDLYDGFKKHGVEMTYPHLNVHMQ